MDDKEITNHIIEIHKSQARTEQQVVEISSQIRDINPRVEKLESAKNRAYGAGAAIGVIGALLDWVIHIFFTKGR